jgi:hypothetical protein
MRERNTDRTKRIGETYATHLFQDMQKPGYAGQKFTWGIFPNMAARLAEAGLFLEFSRNTKHIPKLEQVCRRAAYRKAKELLVGVLGPPNLVHSPLAGPPLLPWLAHATGATLDCLDTALGHLRLHRVEPLIS